MAVGRARTRSDPDAVITALRRQLGGRLPEGTRLQPDTPLSQFSLRPADLAAALATLEPTVAEDLAGIEPEDVASVEELLELAAELADTETVLAGVVATRAPAARPPVARPPDQGPGQGRPPRTVAPPTAARGPQPRPPAAREGTTTRHIERPTGRRMEPEERRGSRAATPRTTVRYTLRHGPELDPRAPRYRRTKRGAGSCSGERQRMVQEAYVRAYEICAGAKHELDRLVLLPDEQVRLLWNGSFEHPEAALGYWFGASVPERGQLRPTVRRIHSTLSGWERGFRVGRFGNRPVIIRCRRHGGGDGTPARHVPQNVIQLYDEFFARNHFHQAKTLLHEMGHWVHGKLTAPRDERHPVCEGGWNKARDMCYQRAAPSDLVAVFDGSNPRALAEAYDRGDRGVAEVMLNNIDNFVSYAWNRHVDRGSSLLEAVVVPTTSTGKPARPAPSKPVPPPPSKPVT